MADLSASSFSPKLRLAKWPVSEVDRTSSAGGGTASRAPGPGPGSRRAAGDHLLLTVPILERMRGVEGWLTDAEADLLIASVSRERGEITRLLCKPWAKR